jgi:hypothetical protein
MKKRLNIIVLALEIAAIIVLHAIKISQSDKKVDVTNQAATYSLTKETAKTNLPYILINVK